MNTKQVEAFMHQKGFSTELSKRIGNRPHEAELYSFRSGYSLWKFFPFEDHIFFHDFDVPGRNSAAELTSLHESEREWVNSLFKTPRWMRYKVPNIVTVAFSSKGFDDEMKKRVSTHAPYGVGGEKHSMHLIDTANMIHYSAGVERTSATAVTGGTVASVTIAPSNVNPSNRAYHLIEELLLVMKG